MKKQNYTVTVLIVSVVLIILVYLAGLFTGLYHSNKLKSQTGQEIEDLREDLFNMEGNLQEVQLQQLFINALGEEICFENQAARISIDPQLIEYWETLPRRIEEFEKYNELSPEYMEVKKEYTRLSLRSWMITKQIYSKCRTGPVPILYIYSADCPDCVRQGEILDAVKLKLLESNISIQTFTVDLNTDQQLMSVILDYYQIDTAPALIIKNKVINKEIILQDEIIQKIVTDET